MIWCVLFAVLFASHASQSFYRTADVKIDDFINSYLRWEDSHPELLHRRIPYKIAVPFIDIYSPDGDLFYHGEDPVTNSSVIQALPAMLPKASSLGAHPSLRDAISMVPQLHLALSSLLSSHQYTLIAVTYPDANCKRCKGQNEALSHLKSRLASHPLNVIQIVLHK